MTTDPVGQPTGPTADPAAAPPTGCGWLLPVAAVTFVLFVALTVAVVVSGGVDGFDTSVYRAALAHRSPAVIAAASVITRLGSVSHVVALVLLGAALLRRLTHRWTSSALLLTSVALTGGIVYLTKVAVGRGRPSLDAVVGTPSVDYAFPSGHTTDGGVVLVLGAALVAATLTRPAARRVIKVGAVALAVAVGLTRAYLGYHWATDVIGGWLLATTVVCVALAAQPVLTRLPATVPEVTMT